MARYTPKSKISVLQTNGNEFLVESTKAPFQGTYMEFSNGTFFAGSDPQRKGQRLIRIEVLKDNFESGFNNMKYNNLKPNIYKNLSKIDSIPPSKPEPTVEDYKRGYFIRYFCKRANEQINYFEIDKSTYNALLNKNNKFDFNLYIVGSIKWNIIRTNSTLVQEVNKGILNLKSQDFPFIETLFTNLNEYEPPYTEGNELFIRTGKKEVSYVGYYHFHPNRGFAMEGPFHIPEKHRRLFEKEERIDRGAIQTISRSISQTPRVTTPTRVAPTPVTPTSTPSVAPSRPSSGGGGGY